MKVMNELNELYKIRLVYNEFIIQSEEMDIGGGSLQF